MTDARLPLAELLEKAGEGEFELPPAVWTGR
jgi:hypothetical protein